MTIQMEKSGIFGRDLFEKYRNFTRENEAVLQLFSQFFIFFGIDKEKK